MSLTALTYQILVALADEARHGYGIIKEIEARAGAAAAPGWWAACASAATASGRSTGTAGSVSA